MSIEEDSYYPEMTITVDEETNARLKKRVPMGLIRPYIEELVKYAAAGSTSHIDQKIFGELQTRLNRGQLHAERIQALEDELRRLKGMR